MGFLKNIFGKKKLLPPVEISRLKTDLHSHFIPGIDDGAQNMEESLEMIREFEKLGFQKVITTPHVMSDYYKNTPESIKSGLSNVKEALQKAGINVEIEAAAEYFVDDDFVKKIGKEELLTFGENYILIELPFLDEPPMFKEATFALQTNGYKPILAHPERYGYWYKNFDKFRELADRQILLQLNLLSLTGHYSSETKKIAQKMVDEELISFVGSDCHRIQHIETIENNLTDEYFHKIMDSGNLMNDQL